jgi:hypothetical protein
MSALRFRVGAHSTILPCARCGRGHLCVPSRSVPIGKAKSAPGCTRDAALASNLCWIVGIIAEPTTAKVNARNRSAAHGKAAFKPPDAEDRLAFLLAGMDSSDVPQALTSDDCQLCLAPGNCVY